MCVLTATVATTNPQHDHCSITTFSLYCLVLRGIFMYLISCCSRKSGGNPLTKEKLGFGELCMVSGAAKAWTQEACHPPLSSHVLPIGWQGATPSSLSLGLITYKVPIVFWDWFIYEPYMFVLGVGFSPPLLSKLLNMLCNCGCKNRFFWEIQV